MSRNKREKITDQINKSNYVFASKVDSFEEAYPTVAALRVEVTEIGSRIDGHPRTLVITENNFRHAVDCSNSLCFGGGVEIGFILHDMACKKETGREEEKMCKGYEGSQKGRKRYGSCLHSFSLKFHVEYKD